MTHAMITAGELLRSDLRRMVRFHAREELPEKIAEYVEENFHPAIEINKMRFQPVLEEKITAIVCGHFKLSLEQIIKNSRKQTYAYPRKILMYLLATRTHMTLKDIGKILNRDHTSVIYGRNDIADLMTSDPLIKDEIVLLNDQL